MLGVKQGILGVKFRIEMLRADASSAALKRGSSLLHHASKNEVGKIDIRIHQMRHFVRNREEVGRSFADEIEGMLEKRNLLPLVEQCLQSFEKTVGREIVVERRLEPVSDVYFDPDHMREVIFNLLHNATEAMERRGKITVDLKETRREVVLRIEDTRGFPRSPCRPFSNRFIPRKIEETASDWSCITAKT